MPIVTLDFESLSEVDYGSIALAVNQALRAAYLDIQDRETLKAAREVTLSIKLTPSGKGFANAEFKIGSKLPGKSTSIPLKLGRDGLTFQLDAQDAPDQLTLTDEE